MWSLPSSWLARLLASLLAFVAPAVYLAIRPIANLVLTGWLAPLLSNTFDFMWKVYEGFWRQFSVVYRLVLAIVKPIFSFLAKLVAPIIALLGPISRAVASVWQSISAMFGKK
jgi:phage-related protein